MHTTRLHKMGNSTAVTLPRDVLEKAGLERGDQVTLQVRDGRIEIVKADDNYARAMRVGREFAARYRRTMATLAK